MPWSSSSVAVAAAMVNALAAQDAAGGLAEIAQQERGGLAALELARDRVNPRISSSRSRTPEWTTSGFSMPGPTSPRSTPTAPPPTPRPSSPPRRSRPGGRGHGLGLALGVPPRPGRSGRRDLPSSRSAPCRAGVSPSRRRESLLTASGPGTQVSLRRYASGSFPVALGTLAPGAAEQLRIPADRSPQPWSVQLSGGGRVTACGREADRMTSDRSCAAQETPGSCSRSAIAASGALLIAWQSHLTFLIDDWDLLLARRGFNAHALLDPHARHLILGPALVYKAIQATLGMDCQPPLRGRRHRLLPRQRAPALRLLCGRRVGDWIALAAVLPVLVMGTAYEDLLSPSRSATSARLPSASARCSRSSAPTAAAI